MKNGLTLVLLLLPLICISQANGMNEIGNPMSQVELKIKNDPHGVIHYEGDAGMISIYISNNSLGVTEVYSFGKSDTCFSYIQIYPYRAYTEFVDLLNKRYVKTDTGWGTTDGKIFIDLVKNEKTFSVSFIDPRYAE